MKLIFEVSALLLGLAGVVLLVLSLHKKPVDASTVEPTDMDRRRFLNRALIGSLGLFGVALGAGSIGFLWPKNVRGRFGGPIEVGQYDDIVATLKREKKPIYNATGKFYLIRYDDSDPTNLYVVGGVATQGLMAISQKCSHLGCRVPYCQTSGYFECPCHDAYFNGAGEVMSGPAPAGMWRYRINVTKDGTVVVDTRNRVAQPPKGTDTLKTGPKGPFCVVP